MSKSPFREFMVSRWNDDKKIYEQIGVVSADTDSHALDAAVAKWGLPMSQYGVLPSDKETAAEFLPSYSRQAIQGMAEQLKAAEKEAADIIRASMRYIMPMANSVPRLNEMIGEFAGTALDLPLRGMREVLEEKGQYNPPQKKGQHIDVRV